MNKLLAIFAALCLMAGGALAASEGRPVFQGSSQNASAFEKMLSEQGSLKNGQVDIAEIGAGLHPWAIDKGVVGEAGKNAKFFQDELVKVYGFHIPYAKFLTMAQKGEFRLPPSVLVNSEVASAPSSATAVVPVETAAAPVVQFAPSVSEAERKKFEQQLTEQNGRIEAQAKVLADLQGQLKQALVDNKSTAEEKQKVTALAGEVTKLQTALKTQADKASKGIAAVTMANGESIADAASKLQKQIDIAVANASAVLGRVSAVESDVKDIKALPIVKYGTPVLGVMVGMMMIFLFAFVASIWRRLSVKRSAQVDNVSTARIKQVRTQRVEPQVDASNNASVLKVA